MVHPESTAAHAVTQVVTLELIRADTSSRLQAELRYTACDPYAATIKFRTGEIEVGWTFGRDLLLDGLHEPTGQGDVHVRPCLGPEGDAAVIIELHSLSGAALVQARACDLHRFVDRMTTLVPQGAESRHLDIDAAVNAILVANPID